MPEIPVVARDLRKVYRVHEREEGLQAALSSFVRRRWRDVAAVEGVSFSIGPGEVVGFLGPNGAGKTTTLKMLSGLLNPTSGSARVLGEVPWERRRSFLARITLVMGNRSQLLWDIAAADSLRVLQSIFEIPDDVYRRVLGELTELLDMGSLLHVPVRNLSLGERMKVEFAAALIHGPRVLFLDEPTIGLDVTMQARIRRFIADYNQRTGASVLLTSHYMEDVVALCRRVIVIHRGHLLYDGALADLAERLAPYKLLGVSFRERVPDDLDRFGDLVTRTDQQVTIRVPRATAAERTARLVQEFGDCLTDLTLEDPPIEEVIDRVFTEGAVQAADPSLVAAGLVRD